VNNAKAYRVFIVLTYLLFLHGCSNKHFMAKEGTESIVVLDVDSRSIILEQIKNESDGSIVYFWDGKSESRYTSFSLKEGSYRLNYWIDPYKINILKRDDVIEIEHGHKYKIKHLICHNNLKQSLFLAPFTIYIPLAWPGIASDIIHKSCHDVTNYSVTLWIEDETTGEVLAGEKWE
jgi:hypothetical protein